jgi:hypothetical protein
MSFKEQWETARGVLEMQGPGAQIMSSKPTLLINTVPLLLAEAPLVENITGSRKSLLSAEINGVFEMATLPINRGGHVDFVRN